jgi:hypothetical protein
MNWDRGLGRTSTERGRTAYFPLRRESSAEMHYESKSRLLNAMLRVRSNESLLSGSIRAVLIVYS